MRETTGENPPPHFAGAPWSLGRVSNEDRRYLPFIALLLLLLRSLVVAGLESFAEVPKFGANYVVIVPRRGRGGVALRPP